MNLPAITVAIMGMMVGKILKFLPRNLINLKKEITNVVKRIHGDWKICGKKRNCSCVRGISSSKRNHPRKIR